MTPTLMALAITLAASLLIQFALVFGFVRRLRSFKTKLIANEDCPESIVILCLRGTDPFLSKCIDGLLTQDYPNYRIRFMVDHPADPAVEILEAELAKHAFDRYTIHSLKNPLNTCSLKCSSLVQAIASVPETTQFVALLDADTIPHVTWLRELATGLSPSDVGAATGNRWYMPTRPSQGAMIRYLWNAAAVVQMYWYRIAWGGTLAIKLDSIRRTGLLDRWRSSLCEDTMLRRQLAKIGQRVEFVPSLMMINREDCTIACYIRWVKRQLLSAKLYHPLWVAVVAHGLFSAAMLLWGLVTMFLLLAHGDWQSGLLTGLAVVGFPACLSAMLPWMQSAVNEILESRGEPTAWNSKQTWWQFICSVWGTQLIYTWALISCMFMRRVEWRGVEYDITDSWNIRLRAYRPLQQKEVKHAPLQSLY